MNPFFALVYSMKLYKNINFLLPIIPVLLLSFLLFLFFENKSLISNFLFNDDSLSIPLLANEISSGNFSLSLWNDFGVSLIYPDIIIYYIIYLFSSHYIFYSSIFYPIFLFCIQIFISIFFFVQKKKYLIFILLISIYILFLIIQSIYIGNLEINSNPIIQMFRFNHVGNLLNVSIAYILYKLIITKPKHSIKILFLLHVMFSTYSNLIFLIHFSAPLILLESYLVFKQERKKEKLLFFVSCFVLSWIFATGMLVNYSSSDINFSNFLINFTLFKNENIILLYLIILNVVLSLIYKKNIILFFLYNFFIILILLLMDKYMLKYYFPLYLINIVFLSFTIPIDKYFNEKLLSFFLIIIPILLFINYLKILKLDNNLSSYKPKFINCIQNFKNKNNLHNGISSYGFSKKYSFFGDGSVIVDFTKYFTPWFWGNSTNWYLNKKFDYIIDFVPRSQLAKEYTFHFPNILSIIGDNYKYEVIQCGKNTFYLGYYVDFNIMEHTSINKILSKRINMSFSERFIKRTIFYRIYDRIIYYNFKIKERFKDKSYTWIKLMKEGFKLFF